MAAKAAAIETVEKSVLAEDDEDDFLLNSNFVQLDIGNQSPMVRARERATILSARNSNQVQRSLKICQRSVMVRHLHQLN